MEKKKKPNSKKMSIMADLASIGIQFPVSIGIGYFIGKYLDGFFGSYPWLTVIFSIFGVVSAFLNVFRLNARLNNIEEMERENDKRESNKDN